MCEMMYYVVSGSCTNINTYWCSTNAEASRVLSGYLFGEVYMDPIAKATVQDSQPDSPYLSEGSSAASRTTRLQITQYRCHHHCSASILPAISDGCQAIERYYKINTRPGCVKPDFKNFNFQANVDDSCEGPSTNLSFGGVYMQCTPLLDGDAICQELAVKNPATGSFSCQQSYTATLLLSETQE
ncbi:hypothetical protein NFI96_029497, partial [Prochilodus magdalenae]